MNLGDPGSAGESSFSPSSDPQPLLDPPRAERLVPGIAHGAMAANKKKETPSEQVLCSSGTRPRGGGERGEERVRRLQVRVLVGMK